MECSVQELLEQFSKMGKWSRWDSPFPSSIPKMNLPGQKEVDLSDEDYNNIYKYVREDEAPTGSIGVSLERAVRKSVPSVRACVLFRGMRMPLKKISALEKQIKKGEAVLSLGTPSSWTNSESVAYKFAKDKGIRHEQGDDSVGVLLEIEVPKGTKGVILDFTFGIGCETVLSGKSVFLLQKIQKYRNIKRFIGKVS